MIIQLYSQYRNFSWIINLPPNKFEGFSFAASPKNIAAWQTKMIRCMIQVLEGDFIPTTQWFASYQAMVRPKPRNGSPHTTQWFGAFEPMVRIV